MVSNNWKGNISIDYIVCLHITYKANTKLHLNLLININQEKYVMWAELTGVKNWCSGQLMIT